MITPFERDMFLRVCDSTSDKIKLGGWSFARNYEIDSCHLFINYQGTPANNEKIKINCYTDDEYSKLISSSDETLISSIGTNFLGHLLIEFSTNISVKTQNKYYFEMEMLDYTRTADSKFISVGYDFYNSRNTNQVSLTNSDWPTKFHKFLTLYGFVK